jgi:hypothetical protein
MSIARLPRLHLASTVLPKFSILTNVTSSAKPPNDMPLRIFVLFDTPSHLTHYSLSLVHLDYDCESIKVGIFGKSSHLFKSVERSHLLRTAYNCTVISLEKQSNDK